MEDFGWIILLAVFWVLSIVGERRKKQGAKWRKRIRERTASGERDAEAEVGPAAGRRSLARDLEEGARRAEEALRRWEARQERREEVPAAPARVDEPRREAPPVQPVSVEPVSPARPPVRRASPIRGPSLLAKGGSIATARRPVAALEEPPVRDIVSGLERIERLAPLQRAVVWSELLGPPVSLREDA